MTRTDPNFIRAKKSLGQNFCVDERIPTEIVKRLAATKEHCIWEIGPGKGALTSLLRQSGADLHLFEIDQRMQPILEKDFPEARITWGDFLELKELPIPDKPLLVTGNLPYYCGTPIIRRFLECGPETEKLVFLLQHEVAAKACATINSRDYGYLSVQIAFFADAELGSTFGPGSFSPPPKVNSSILEIRPFKLSDCERQRRILLLRPVSMLFAQRRKMALPLLKKMFKQTDWAQRFAELGIEEKARPENISPQQFMQLFSTAEIIE